MERTRSRPRGLELAVASPRFRLSPSRVARFFFHECERYLRYRTATAEQRRADGIPSAEEDRSVLTRAILQGGFDWEEVILRDHLGNRAVIAAAEDAVPLHERRHDFASTIAILATAEPGQVIYQPTLEARPAVYDAYGLDPAFVQFVDCHPDLLAIEEAPDGGRHVVVVDAKASDLMKLSHRIQVALYSLILEHALADSGVVDLGVAREGGVWLYGEAEPERFSLSSTRPPLETFLAEDLTPLLSAPAGDAFWHLYFRCEWCDYFHHCRDEAEATDDVSLVPYLSTFAKRHLATRAGVRTVRDLSVLLDRNDVNEVLVGCGSLEGRASRLRIAVDALEEGKPIPTGTASVGMPVREHVRVILTVQSEPLTGAVYGYAINRFSNRKVFDEPTATVVGVASDDSLPELARLRAALVRDLMAILGPVDEHNRVTDEWREQQTLQCYVFDGYERELLVQALLEEATSGDAREDALALLFHFQHPDLAVADDHPKAEVFFPLIALTDVVRQVTALPAHVVYRLADVNAFLQPSQYGFEYRHDDFHSFELSNRMKSNAIFEVWHRGRGDLLAGIERELRQRVWSAGSVINGLREHLEPTGALFAWPPKFRLPEGLDLVHDVLSRLVFISRYESVLRYLEARAARARPEGERAAGERSLLLTYEGDGCYRLDPRQVDAEVDVHGFWKHILTIDDDEGRRARLAFDDFPYRSALWAPKAKPLALAEVAARPEPDLLRLELKPTPAFELPAAGRRCTLDERYTDWTTGRLVEELVAMDGDGDPWFLRALTDPVGTRRALPLGQGARDELLGLARGHGMTASQLAAFEGVVDTDLQLVWGPPGTGKTHFLALAVLCLVESARRRGETCRVLITGFTHNAIDNVLAKVRDLQQGSAVVDGPFVLRKVHDGGAPVETVAPKNAESFGAGHPLLVYGATVWQARKLSPAFTYDVVVIDEGSQLKVAESAIPIRRLADGGRLVIAGDDRQLPPIVAGAYPEIEGLPPLHRSVLEALRVASDDVLTAPLLENWRMCDRLCGWPSASIYPPSYGPATAEVSDRRLSLEGAPADPVIGLLLDPAFPVTVAVTEDVQATRENPFEARLVADLVTDVRHRCTDEDDAFSRDRVFVVGPHHAQNRLVRRRLAEARDWDAPPFVDTVDKMQGQECDLVVVSYGVSDVEYALSEKEFIYSLNRLNVAVTRARRKTVVLLSRLLLEPPLQALDRDEVAEGIAFMQGLARWCETNGERVETQHNGHRLTILRA